MARKHKNREISRRVRVRNANTLQNRTFPSVRLGLAASDRAVSVAGFFGLGRFGLETFGSDYEILQKFYMLTLQCKPT